MNSILLNLIGYSIVALFAGFITYGLIGYAMQVYRDNKR